jgi:hemerythrin-like domain-containing protein
MENHSTNDPFEILHTEHREVLGRLQELEEAVTSIVGKGFSAAAFSRIAGVIRFFSTEFKNHDRSEEKVLFPLIEAHIEGVTATYRAEHRQLWSAFDRLQKSVQDVEMSKVHGSTIREIVDASRTIIDLLRAHVARENGELFPLAKKVLSKEEFIRLTTISHIDKG